MSVKIFCKLTDCINWDNGLCSAEEIQIDRQGYCATYEEIPEEAVDELDLDIHDEDLDWEDEEEDLEIRELGEDIWKDLEEEEAEEEHETPDKNDPWL